MIVAAGASGCSSTSSKDSAGTVLLDKTTITSINGAAGLATPGAEDAKKAAEKAAGKKEPCRHQWVEIREGTHSWIDESSGLPTVSLCTPMQCSRCGEIRHECSKRRR